MFDAVMATAGAPRRGSSKGASPGSLCVKGCVWQVTQSILWTQFQQH